MCSQGAIPMMKAKPLVGMGHSTCRCGTNALPARAPEHTLALVFSTQFSLTPLMLNLLLLK